MQSFVETINQGVQQGYITTSGAGTSQNINKTTPGSGQTAVNEDQADIKGSSVTIRNAESQSDTNTFSTKLSAGVNANTGDFVAASKKVAAGVALAALAVPEAASGVGIPAAVATALAASTLIVSGSAEMSYAWQKSHSNSSEASAQNNNALNKSNTQSEQTILKGAQSVAGMNINDLTAQVGGNKTYAQQLQNDARKVLSTTESYSKAHQLTSSISGTKTITNNNIGSEGRESYQAINNALQHNDPELMTAVLKRTQEIVNQGINTDKYNSFYLAAAETAAGMNHFARGMSPELRDVMAKALFSNSAIDIGNTFSEVDKQKNDISSQTKDISQKSATVQNNVDNLTSTIITETNKAAETDKTVYQTIKDDRAIMKNENEFLRENASRKPLSDPNQKPTTPDAPPKATLEPKKNETPIIPLDLLGD